MALDRARWGGGRGGVFSMLKQNSMAHLNQCLLLNTKETQQCCIQKLNPSFLFDLHQGMVTNEHQYVTKMALCATMRGLWGDFNAIFWIVEYFTTANLYLE